MTILIFYRNQQDLVNFKGEFKSETNKWIFIEIKDYRAQKSVSQKFVENELTSIPIFNKLINNFSLFRKLIEKIQNRSKNNTKTISNSRIKSKIIFEYITPVINDKADKLARELYDLLKEKTFFLEKFIINDLNLFEINRLELVELFYHTFLDLLSINRIFTVENPKKIYILPSIDLLSKVLIKKSALKNKIECIVIEKGLNRKQLYINKYRGKIRNFIERVWYWNIWNITNRKALKIRDVSPNKKKNLVLGHYKNYFPSLIQVFRQTERKGQIQNILFAPHKLVNLSKEVIKNERFRDVILYPIHDVNYKLFRKDYNKLGTIFKEIITDNSFNDVLMESYIVSDLVKIMLFYSYEHYAYSLRYHLSLKKVIDKFKPDLITGLSGNDSNEVLGAKIANDYKIPTLFIPHALIAPTWEYIKLTQDYIVCTGERDKEYYVSLGTDPKKISILGISSYDKVYNNFQKFSNPEEIKQETQKSLKIEKNKKIVLFVSSWHEDFKRKRQFLSVYNAINDMKECFLVVKIHPLEDREFYLDLLKDLDDSNILIIDEPILYDLIIASDLVIGSSSGAQIEALLLNKNVIDLIYNKTYGIYYMDKWNAAIPVYKPDDLKEAINVALYDKSVNETLNQGRKKYCEYCLHKFDGNSSKRIVELIEKILKI